MCRRVFGRARRQDLIRATVQARLQVLSHRLRDLALDREDIGQLAIVGVRPEVGVIERVD